jgi:hypothetical protein
VSALAPEIRNRLKTDFLDKLKTLSLAIWEGRANGPQIEAWLSNFTGQVVDAESEHIYVLYLLTRFMYYGQREMKALLHTIYRDLFKYPLIANIRRANSNTRNTALINGLFQNELDATRFIGLGGPAKSGSMLLYPFRQVTQLDERYFSTIDAVLSGRVEATPPVVKRYVFIDDLCGSGDQATDYNAEYAHPIRLKFGSAVELCYFVMFATTEALSTLRPPSTAFDRIEAVHELDGSFKCFGVESRYLPTSELDRAVGQRIAATYGGKLFSHPLGFRQCQLLLGFSHNVPDNTLPIVWSKEASWKPIFERS